ncbi:MAG: sugar phosphate isomerase/epimerase family protein, partial [Chloroflexota bacterium]
LNLGALRIELPFGQALALAREAGFDGLDLPLDELLDLAERTSPREVAERFAAAGVRPGAWGLPVDFRADDVTFQSGLNRLPRYAAMARDLGADRCATWILPYSDRLDFDANMEMHAGRLRPICRVLAEHGCRLGIEFVGPATLRAGHAHQFIHTIGGALDLAQHIGTGNVGLLLDCFHWYTSHGTAEDLAGLHASDIIYVHVNDASPGRDVDEQLDQERMLPGGSGLIDITTFLGALSRMGYDGPVAVEPFNAEVNALPPAERARAAALSLHQVYQRAGLRSQN